MSNESGADDQGDDVIVGEKAGVADEATAAAPVEVKAAAPVDPENLKRTFARVAYAVGLAEKAFPSPDVKTLKDFAKYCPEGMVITPSDEEIKLTEGQKLTEDQKAGREELQAIAEARGAFVDRVLKELDQDPAKAAMIDVLADVYAM